MADKTPHGEAPPLGYRPPTEAPPLGYRPSSTEPGLEEPGWNPEESLSWGAAGALGGRVLGPWGMLLGGAGGFAGDVLYQIAHNQTQGLPWYLGIPAELAAALMGAKAGVRTVETLGNIGRGITRRAPQALEEIAADVGPGTFRGPVAPELLGSSKAAETESFFRPELEYKGRGKSQTVGQGPNVSVEHTLEVKPLENRGFTSNTEAPSVQVNEAWPKVVSVRQPGSIWENVVKTGKEETIPTPKLSKEVRVAEKAAQIVEAIKPPPGSVWGDVRNYVRSGQSMAGEFFSPILSAIERAAGPVVGPQLVALEGAHAAAEGRIWQQLFGPLTDQLRRLPEKLHGNFVDTLEGRAKALNPTVDNAVNSFRKVFGTEGSAVIAQQGAGLQVTPLENYFMHEFEPAFVRGLMSDPGRQAVVASQMVKDGIALSKQEARSMIKAFLSRPGRSLYRPRPTGAEFDRNVNMPGWITNPVQAVTQRGRGISRRLADLEVYGNKQLKVRQLIDQLSGPAREQTERLFRYTMGRDPVEEGLQKAASRFMGLQAVTSLSLSGIMNISQPSLLALRTSLPNMAKAIFATARHPMESWAMARQLGIYADMAQRQLMMDLAGGTGGKITQASLRMFNWTERIVRSMAAEGGADWAKTIQQKLVAGKPKEAPWLIRELTRLNFTKPEVERLLITKTLTPNDVNLIKWSIADQISFLPRPGRKSEFYLRSPMGPVLLQFKNFLMNSGRLLKQTVFDELRAGNRAPLYRSIGIVFPTLAAMGEVPADINAALRGSHRPAVDPTNPGQLFNRALDNVLQIGAFGLGLGLIQEMTGLKTNNYQADLPGALLGPTVGMLGKDLAAPVKSIYYAAKGDTAEAKRQAYEAVRHGLRRLPYAGPWLANAAFPSSVQPATEANDDLWTRLGFSQYAIERQKLRDLDARLRHLGQ